MTLATLIILSQLRTWLDLRLLHGTLPWSLAGISGNRRDKGVKARDALVARIDNALQAAGLGGAKIEVVDRRSGRLGLVIDDLIGERSEWQWPE